MNEKRYLLERVGPAAVVQLYIDAFADLSLSEKRLAWLTEQAVDRGRYSDAFKPNS